MHLRLRVLRALLTLGLAVPFLTVAPDAADASAPANPSFQETWERTDLPVATGAVSRTWMWGPEAFTPGLVEAYLEGDGGERQVQYYDKSRMELTHPDADANDVWYVTNGLLVVELVTGRLQLGDGAFLQLDPAAVNVAGDPDDPTGPTYATIGTLLDEPAAAVGATLTARLDRAGNVSSDANLAAYGATAAMLDDVTQHAIASPFWAFMTSNADVLVGDEIVNAPLFEDPYYATGRPLSEAYWATVDVGGRARDVLIQCFERRCLTWTPDNPDGWQVEMGNVGRHYYAWRYASGQVYLATVVHPDESLSAAVGDDLQVSLGSASVAGTGILTVVQGEAPANGPAVAVTTAWDLELLGTQLTGAATLTFTIDLAQLPNGVTPAEVYVATWDTASSTWIPQPTTVDPTALTASVAATHFSTWQAFAPSGPNEPPVLDLDGDTPGTGSSTSFTAGDAPAPIAGPVVITDGDDSDLASAQLAITGRENGTNEQLAADTTGTGITASFDAAGGILSLSGVAPSAVWEQVLDSVTYANVASSPSTGMRQINVVVNDGEAVSNVAAALVMVLDDDEPPPPPPADNADPSAAAQSVTVAEDASVAIALGASDPDGDGLTFNVVAGPSHGTLSGSGPNLTYTPAANYNGPDSFTFSVSDGNGGTDTAVVSITVTPINDAPVANPQSVSVAEDGSVVIALTGSDVDGDPLTVTVVSGPTHGTLTGSGANRRYRPDDDYNGPDSFTFVVSDGLTTSAPATVSITVIPRGDDPVANDDAYAIDEDEVLAPAAAAGVLANDVDPDGDPLTAILVSGPAHAQSFTLNADGSFTYVPDTEFSGSDSFTYMAGDGSDESNVATVTITIGVVNDPPTVSDQTVVVDEDSSVAITLTGSDAENEPLTFSIVSGPSHGTVDWVDGTTFIYTPDPDFDQTDVILFKANDGTSDSAIGTITIQINPDYEETIDADTGGVIEIPGEISVTIEPGGFTEDAIVSITPAPLPAPGDAPPDLCWINDQSWFIEVEPVDPQTYIEFTQPIKITFTYDPALVAACGGLGSFVIVYNDGEGWGYHVPEYYDIDTVNHTVTVYVWHFSRWGIALSVGAT